VGSARVTFDRVRVTRVGVWYLIVTLVVAVAAVNTGNNALFLIEGAILALLVASGIASRRNLRNLDLNLARTGEIYAGNAMSIAIVITNLDQIMARRFLEIGGPPDMEPLVVPYIKPRGVRRDRLYFCFRRRGLHRIPTLRLTSIFPLGLFQKSMRIHTDVELLVYPELLALDDPARLARGQMGDDSSPRAGWGHDLYALRSFRPGDDPRGIHWKRTARTGELVYLERAAEEGRKVSILFDNAVGPLEDQEAEDSFERLVSEAASASVDYLEAGFEVALTTRTDRIRFGRGATHRRRLLETLALVPVLAFDPAPLTAGPDGGRELRLGRPAERAVAG
jgi:uncharacterized protein (DUF58 family)